MLTKRLLAVKKAVGKGNILYDVGTDHGYVPISLVKDKLFNYAIASDINEGPLLNAKKNITNAKLSDKIKLRVGDGLSTMEENEADVILIAGMGGVLISNILDKDIKKARTADRLVLQPNTHQEHLRKFLFNNDFSVEKEIVVSENNKYYNILVVKNGKDEPYSDESYYDLGRPFLFDLSHSETKKYIKYKKRKFINIINELSKSKEKDIKKIEKFNNFLKGTDDFYGKSN